MAQWDQKSLRDFMKQKDAEFEVGTWIKTGVVAAKKHPERGWHIVGSTKTRMVPQGNQRLGQKN